MKWIGFIDGIFLSIAILFTAKFIVNPEIEWLMSVSCLLYGFSLSGFGLLLGMSVK